MWRRVEDWGGVSNFYRPTPKFTYQKKCACIFFNTYKGIYRFFRSGGTKVKTRPSQRFRAEGAKIFRCFSKNLPKRPPKNRFVQKTPKKRPTLIWKSMFFKLIFLNLGGSPAFFREKRGKGHGLMHPPPLYTPLNTCKVQIYSTRFIQYV